MVRYKIATIGSHSALQILKGAKDEGFQTIAICKKGSVKIYEQFGIADEIIIVDDLKDFYKIEEELIQKNAIIIPHGSLIEYVGTPYVEKMKIPYFGNKKVLRWESDRNIERQWLSKANIKLPKIFDDPKEIDRTVIVKFYGAKGGKGYFIANSYQDFLQKIRHGESDEKFAIQEYIIGVPIYSHFFYSPITKKLELLGFDIRYESNVDSLGRISARDQMALKSVDPSYVVVGNKPVVIRESLLPKIYEMAENVIKVADELIEGGLYGPFCLEHIITPDQEIYTFEISARIVAGTNLYLQGSDFSWLYHNEPMSTGRRIAREIKIAIEQDKLNLILQ